MTIQEFDKLFWENKWRKVDDHMYSYFYKKGDSKSGRNSYGYYDQDTTEKTVSNFANLKLNATQIEAKFNRVPFEVLNKKKFTLGEYTFYCYGDKFMEKDYTTKKDSEEHFKFSVIMDFHGLRRKVIEFESFRYVDNQNYGKSIEGIYEFLDVLENLDYTLLEDIEDIQKTLFGGQSMKPDSKFHITPGWYPREKDGYGSVGEIDLDYFVLKETKDGLYKPSAEILGVIMGHDHSSKLKSKVKKLNKLGVHTVQFRNNAYFYITSFYDLEGVELKASKSVLSKFGDDLLKFSKNDKAKAEIKAKEKAAEEERKLYEYNDTYTLMQHGRVVLKDVRSYEIENYFEEGGLKEFEDSVIEAGKKCFEVAPELSTIYFMEYGIYPYTELAGEHFAHAENLESLNKKNGVELPKRLITLLETKIETPWFDTDSDYYKFEKGCTIIGATQDKDGNVTMVHEPGELNL